MANSFRNQRGEVDNLTLFIALVGAIGSIAAIKLLSNQISERDRELLNNRVKEATQYIRSTTDLDNNGLTDLVISYSDGRKVPMFGVKQADGSTKYFTASGMTSQAQKVDYLGIEAKLNAPSDKK